ncbi:MAG: hypothetical protein AABX91_00770 [Nanoarchaeota archaeon]
MRREQELELVNVAEEDLERELNSLFAITLRLEYELETATLQEN